MRRLALAAAVAAALAASACVRSREPLAVHEARTFPAPAGKLVRVDARSLDVDVTVAPAAVISAEVEVNARSSSRAAGRRWLERNQPVFEDSESTLEVRQPSRTGGVFVFGYLNATARVRLTVPPGCRLEVRTTSGDVTVGGEAQLPGPVRVTTSSGDVTVTGGLTELIAKTSSGDVTVRGRELAAFEAETTSGDVKLESGSARGIVDTTSGDVRLERLGGALSADSSSGEVAASWAALPAGARVQVHTTSGDVRLRVPEGAAVRGSITTRSGEIRSDVGGAGGRRGRELTLDASGEAAELDVRTTSGDVTVHVHP